MNVEVVDDGFKLKVLVNGVLKEDNLEWFEVAYILMDVVFDHEHITVTRRTEY